MILQEEIAVRQNILIEQKSDFASVLKNDVLCGF